MMIKNQIIIIGQKVKFDPMRSANVLGMRDRTEKNKVIGTVVAIYPKKHWFLVEYELGESILKTGFKMDEINNSVFLIK